MRLLVRNLHVGSHDESEKVMAFLTNPLECYQDSYLVALQEFQAEGKHLEISLEEVVAHFGSFVQQLHEQADRAKIKP